MMSIRIEAKTLDLALIRAAGQLGVAQDRLAYTVEEKSSGFLGLFGQKVIIKAWAKADRAQQSGNDRNGNRNFRSNDGRRDQRHPKNNHRNANNSQQMRQNDSQTEGEGAENNETRESISSGRRTPARRVDEIRGRRPDRHQNRFDKTSRSTENTQDHADEEEYQRVPAPPINEEQMIQVKAELSAFVSELAFFMLGEKVAVDVNLVGERMIFDLKNEYLSAQIAKNIKIAESFEHLIRKKPRELQQDLPFRVFIDALNARLNREAELAEMAKDLSNQVHESKQPVVLNYRRSYDRKIIHMTLDQDQRVITKSIGKGPNRKLMILPANEAPLPLD
jgi:spoIIIJ-associated protein